MGQSSSVLEEGKLLETTQETTVSNKIFETMESQRKAQQQQQLVLLNQVNQEIPTSKVQIQDLININKQFYEPIKRPDLKKYKYTINGSLTI